MATAPIAVLLDAWVCQYTKVVWKAGVVVCAGCNVRWAIRKLWLDAPILVPVCRGHYRFSGPACGEWLVGSVVSIGLVFVCG